MPGIKGATHLLFNQATGDTLMELTNSSRVDILLPCMLEQYEKIVLPVDLQ